MVAGWSTLVWCVMVGLLAIGMSLLKVLEPDNSSGMDQLLLSVGATLLAVLLCYGVIRLGRTLLPRPPQP